MNHPPLSTIEEIIQTTDDNLAAYARKAGKRASDRALEKLGSVMKVESGKLVRQFRDGSVEVLKIMPAGQAVRVGAVFKLKKTKTTG